LAVVSSRADRRWRLRASYRCCCRASTPRSILPSVQSDVCAQVGRWHAQGGGSGCQLGCPRRTTERSLTAPPVCWRRTAKQRAEPACLPVEEHPRSEMQSRRRLVEQIGQRSQRHDHKRRSSNNVERCRGSRTPTCSVQSLNHCIEDTSSRTESNRRT
jgi:hypothetical protein